MEIKKRSAVSFFLSVFLLLNWHTFGQSNDSLLLQLNAVKAGDYYVKYGLLCRLASGSVEADSIIKYSEEAIKVADDGGLNPCQALVLKGFGYLYSGRLTSAVESFLDAARFYEIDNNPIGLAAAYANLAEAYNQQENFSNARTYLSRAVDIFRAEKDTVRLASSLHNLGYTYLSMERYDSAIVILSETGEIYRSLAMEDEYATCLGNKGLAYYGMEKRDSAEFYLLRAAELLESHEMTVAGRALLEFRIKYAAILQEKGETGKAIEISGSSYRKAKSDGFLEFERDAAYRLAMIYGESGSYDSAYIYLKEYLSANDSIMNVKRVQEIADLRTEYEVAKKQAEVTALEKNRIIQLIVIVGLLLVLCLAVGLILMYYYSLKKSRKLTAELDERRILLEKQGVELKEQREELIRQKGEIISSINYAKYIQSSLLPQPEQLNSLLGEHFVLYRPKDIVSGDFYWISGIENKTVVAAVDCTGHGVPGAFMSMLGTALLNEVVNKEYITHPGVVLRRLRKEVINSLRQKGERGEQKDGMDISLCTIDFENMKLQYSGANNPLYIVRKKNTEPVGTLRCEPEGEYCLYEIKGDLMPIGISDKMSNFTFHEIDIFKGDTLYMFSDGFPDQFGGPDNKKFGYRKFRDLLLRNSSEAMEVNREILERVLDEWMGGSVQIDDILVIGFRIG